MNQNGTSNGAQLRPRPRRREFAATIGTEDLGRYAGVGLTVEAVIAEELGKIDCATAAAAQEPAAESDDLVIWEGNKVVALVRIGADGRPVATRLDRASGRTPGVHALPPDEPALEAPRSRAVYPEGAPSGQGPNTREALAAIRHFHALRRFAAEVRQLCHDAARVESHAPQEGPGQTLWTRWNCLGGETIAYSEDHLRRSIAALQDRMKTLTRRPDAVAAEHPCGVIMDGSLYVALPAEAGGALVRLALENVVMLDRDREGTPDPVE
jgi:hypothetical protein